LGRQEHSAVSDSIKGLTPALPAACTGACTSEPETDNASTSDGGEDKIAGTDEGGPLDKLAAALLTLSPADRERLAAILASKTDAGDMGTR